MVGNKMTIFRKSTEDEKEDFVDLRSGKRNSLNMFLAKVAERQQVFMKQRRPFCTRCAKVDFEQKVKHVIEETTLTQGTAFESTNFKESDLDKYADVERFEFVKKREAHEKKLIDGLNTVFLSGHHYVFRCKKRGCGFSIYVPIADDKEMQKVLKEYTDEAPEEVPAEEPVVEEKTKEKKE